jgi:hypothetical protein
MFRSYYYRKHLLVLSLLPVAAVSFSVGGDRCRTLGRCWQNPTTTLPPSMLPQSVIPRQQNYGLHVKDSSSSSTVEDDSPRSLSSSSPTADPARPRGVYVRPSAAVERGAGFFVPGLPGPRVRLLVGMLGLVLAAWNHYYDAEGAADNILPASTSSSSALIVSEGIAVVFSCFVLLQGAIESIRDSRRENNSDGSGSATRSRNYAVPTKLTTQKWLLLPSSSSSSTNIAANTSTSNDWRQRVEWATQTYLALTPASLMWLLDAQQGVLFRLEQQESRGAALEPLASEEEEKDLTASSPLQPQQQQHPSFSSSLDFCREALKLLSQSSTGRVSLPVSHPVAQALLRSTASSSTSSSYRTMVLQRIIEQPHHHDDNDNNPHHHQQLCLVMASSDLLAAFRQQDLVWLGQLAKYIGSSSVDGRYR